MKPLILLLTVLTFLSCGYKKKSTNLSEKIWERYQLDLPSNFVLKEFESHDIIFLGETHRKKNDLIFLQQLIPKLYKKGIYLLFYEFASHDDNNKIDSILTAPTYDEGKVKSIIHNNFWEWPYKEYLDIFRVAWRVNNKHKNGKKFRIIGISYSNSNDVKQAMKDWTEKDWANLIFKDAISKSQKAIVYCGNHHSITKYKQPLIINGEFKKLLTDERVGQFVYKMIGEKAMTIWIHFPWGDINYDPSYPPVIKYLDSLSLAMDSSHKQFAFSTTVSELGNLIDSTSVYSTGYKKIKLKNIVDGYIVLGPVCKEDFVSYVPDFNTKENIENTNSQIKYFYGYKNLTVNQANDTLKKWYYRDEKEFYDFRKSIGPCH